MAPSHILIGPPGAGKSSVGKQLSKALSLSFTDTDAEIERETGRKITDIFVEDGEAVFRQIEKKIVLDRVKNCEGVLSLGGGSVLDPEVADSLRSNKSKVIYLEVSISNAAPRVGFNKERPLLAVNPRQQWLSLMEKRRPIYEELAGIKISTDGKKPNEVAREIKERSAV
ncbi:MAG: hypothetical protein RL129_36 [Actinomycetota bacterium]|jgi:shikimate kinase